MGLRLCGGCGKNKCKRVFEGIPLCAKATRKMANSAMQYMNSARRMHLTQTTTNQSWVAPPSTILKINVDSSTVQETACAATICRESQGRVKPAAVTRVDTSDSKHADVDAILLGLKLTANMRDTSCIIVSDAKSLVLWVCNKDSVPSWRVALSSTSL